MKKVFLLATALAALVSCTSEDFVGENNNSPDPATNTGEKAIVFNSGANTITRATHVGADAAGLLGEKFIVEGFKLTGSAWSEVFNNYYVTWTANTAGKTESNTSDWEYVGPEAAAPSTLPSGAVQSIKYWDYSSSQYDFAAYSTGKLSADNIKTTLPDGGLSAGQVLISTITKADTYAGPTYTLQGDVAALKECYISDLVSAYKTNGDASDYQKEVTLSFRRLASKVRVALYETVPGYSVKSVNFYQDDATTAITADITSNTNATLIGTFNSNGTYTVSFPTIGSSNKSATDYNKAHVAFAAASSGGTNTTLNLGALNYGAAEKKEAAGNSYLGRTSPGATYAGTTSPYYTDVLPNETSGALELRINYTLVSTDGSGEEIKIYGAKAFVPAIYAQWKPNYAYTYIFKITDDTSGWSSQVNTDPTGLYPITFDAVVVDAEDFKQSTITTVATPSITTYQKGHDVSKNEYAATSDSIYVQVMVDGALKNDLNTKGKLYTVTGGPSGAIVTEAEVMDALNINAAGSTTSPVTGRNTWVLTEATVVNATGDATFGTIPGVDGNNIPNIAANTAARFLPAAGTYAYVYDATPSTAPDATYIYTAVAFTSTSTAPDDWSGNYWDNPNGTGSAVTTFEAPASGTKYYYRRYTNQNKVYGVKVIKIEAAAVVPSGS